MQTTTEIEGRDVTGRIRTGLREHRREVGVLATLTLVLAASVIWQPADDGGFILCAFRRVTGLPCMGCGLTRSFCAIAKGQAARAFAFHALGPPLFAAACVYWLRGAAFFAGRRGAVGRFDAAVRRWRIPLVALVLLLVVWVARLVALGLEGRLGELARQGMLWAVVGRR